MTQSSDQRVSKPPKLGGKVGAQTHPLWGAAIIDLADSVPQKVD